MPSAPDQIWVGDITVHLARAFAYLAVVLDPFSRKAVGPDRSNNRERNVGIDEEHSRRPKGGPR